MSARNRKKLIDGLAKAGILSKSKWQKLYPKIVGIDLHTYFGGSVEIDTGIRTIRLEKHEDFKALTNCKIPVGSKITYSAGYSWERPFALRFRLSTGEVLTVRTISKSKDETASFLVPSSTKDYKYSKAQRDAYNLPSSNVGTGTYPNCREW